MKLCRASILVLCILMSLEMWLHSGAVSLPLSVSSRWIVDASETRVKLACVSWAAHLETMVPEGLDKQPLATITGLIASSGFNCVRLTYATYMFTRQALGGQTVVESLESWDLDLAAKGVIAHNPGLAHLSVVEAYREVVKGIAAKNLMIVLDNHMSSPGWCCSDDDGNGFWEDRFFDPEEWLRGLQIVADLALDCTNVVGLGLRNEPRGPRQNAAAWRKYMAEGAEIVHGLNPNVLIFMSGLSYASDLTFLYWEPLAFKNQFLRSKLVYEVHWYAWSSGTGYSNGNPNTNCAADIGRFMNETGFLVASNHAYTSPLVVSEFGMYLNGESPGDDRFMDCYFALASKLDLDWVLWALQGSYYRKDGQADYEEVYGLLTRSWDRVRNPSFLQRLRGLQYPLPGPSSGDGTVYRALFHPATGLCVSPDSDSGLLLSPCSSSSSVWAYDSSADTMLKLKGSSAVVKATAEGSVAKLGSGVDCEGCHWTLVGDTRLQFTVYAGGRSLCLDGKSGSAITTRDCLCVSRYECEGNQVVPTSQWFQFIEALSPLGPMRT